MRDSVLQSIDRIYLTLLDGSTSQLGTAICIILTIPLFAFHAGYDLVARPKHV